MSADPSVEENFSAIDVRCLPCGLPSPPPSLPSRIMHHPHPLHQQHQQVRVQEQTWRISRVCTRSRLAFGGRRRSGPGNPTVQAWSRVASASQARLIPRHLLPTAPICPMLSLQSAYWYEQFSKMAPKKPGSLLSISEADYFQGESIKDSWRCVFTKSCVAAF